MVDSYSIFTMPAWASLWNCAGHYSRILCCSNRATWRYKKKGPEKRGKFATLHLNPSPTDLSRRLPLTSERPQLQQYILVLTSALKAFAVLVASRGSGVALGHCCWGNSWRTELAARAGCYTLRMEGMVLALWLNIQWVLCTTPSKTNEEGRKNADEVWTC